VAGSEGLQTLAQNYLNTDKPVKALHVLEVALAGEPTNKVSLGLRQKALQILIARAESGLRNDYEIYWLKARLADTERDLSVQGIDN
jgi:hypothetical protein